MQPKAAEHNCCGSRNSHNSAAYPTHVPGRPCLSFRKVEKFCPRSILLLLKERPLSLLLTWLKTANCSPVPLHSLHANLLNHCPQLFGFLQQQIMVVAPFYSLPVLHFSPKFWLNLFIKFLLTAFTEYMVHKVCLLHTTQTFLWNKLGNATAL